MKWGSEILKKAVLRALKHTNVTDILGFTACYLSKLTTSDLHHPLAKKSVLHSSNTGSWWWWWCMTVSNLYSSNMITENTNSQLSSLHLSSVRSGNFQKFPWPQFVNHQQIVQYPWCSLNCPKQKQYTENHLEQCGIHKKELNKSRIARHCAENSLFTFLHK